MESRTLLGLTASKGKPPAAIEPLVSQRPQRWDSSFDPQMSPADVARILQLSPFREMDPQAFPKRLPLAGILQHDTRLRRFKPGQLIVRQGDYGTSAFMVVSGTARVVLQPGLPESVLGRRESKKKSLLRVFTQIFNSTKEPETRSAFELSTDPKVRAQSAGGEVRVFLQDIPRLLDKHLTALMEAGEFFGEISALGRIPRTATIFAQSDVELLEIRWQGLRDLLRYDDKLKNQIDKIYRERALASHLRQIPLFKNLNQAQLERVMQQTEFATFGDYDWSGEYKRSAKLHPTARSEKEPVIVQEGDYPNGVILVRAGFARLSRKFGRGQRTLNYLGAGQHYGFEEIAHNWRNKSDTVPFRFTLTATGYTHALIVPTAIMEEVVLPTLPARDLPKLAAMATPESAAAEAAAEIAPDMMEFLAENRFFNGTATMVIDLDQCTRCDDCVRACASTHNGNPRFLRHGPINGNIMIANACMHCADPVCLIGCPTGAIHRDTLEGNVLINQATCIGCQACANNCPYEAIRMVSVRDRKGAFLVDQEMKPLTKATKCDLCAEQHTGPACARACPHDALERVNMNDLDSFAAWLKR